LNVKAFISKLNYFLIKTCMINSTSWTITLSWWSSLRVSVTHRAMLAGV